MALCSVSITDEAGKRWTMEVEARSLYSAVFSYNAEQVAGTRREYPKLHPDVEIEVRLGDGRTFRTTLAKAQRWANREGSAKK